MQLPTETDILIVGGGPAGMAAALSLSHHAPHAKFVIVDALETGQNQSRALVIHSHTLELLNAMGYAEPFIAAGRRAKSTSINSLDGRLFALDSYKLGPWTRFPFFLIIAQSTTEVIFRNILTERGIEIFRPFVATSVQEISDPNDQYKVRVNFEGGKTIKAKYIVAADSAKSLVRHSLGIKFAHIGEGEQSFFSLPDDSGIHIDLADVILETPLTPDQIPEGISITFGPQGFFLFVPIPRPNLSDPHSVPTYDDAHGELMYRLAFPVFPGDMDERNKDPNGYLVRRMKSGLAICEKNGKIAIPPSRAPKIKEVLWSNAFKVHNGIAETFFKSLGNDGKVLLIGDAAHLHSPAGGQGMNLGICDGVTIGAAIAAHLQEPTNDGLLARAAGHRRDTAGETITMTRRLNYIGTLGTGWKGWARDWVLWTMGSVPNVRRGAAWGLSGLADFYTKGKTGMITEDEVRAMLRAP